ncbi:MAG: transposase [Thermofilum sp.]|nr:transposase [Thermofilum sp.]
MDRGKGGGLRGGFRVFRVHVDGGNMERLRQLFRDFVDGSARVKGALCYRDEWLEEWGNVLRMREEAGKRTMPNPPAALLPARFTMPDGTTRGDKNAPCVIDLRRRELRVPSYGVSVPLRGSLAKALVGENELEPRPDFVLQVTRRGFVRIIAQRETYSALGEGDGLRLICIDENSSYGFVVAVFDYDGKWRLACFRICRPPNHGYRERVISLLKSYADKPTREMHDALSQRHDLALTPERARELAEETRRKERRANNAFIAQLVGDLRKILREARERGMHVAVLIDPIDADTLRGTPLQRTLLRVSRRIRNLARYEGAEFRLLRSSGKQCPICGSWGVEVAPRTCRCPSCGITWNRDRGAVARLPVVYFLKLHESYREECDDHSALPLLLLHKYTGFLKRHAKFLNPFPSGAAAVITARKPPGLQRAGPRRV